MKFLIAIVAALAIVATAEEAVEQVAEQVVAPLKAAVAAHDDAHAEVVKQVEETGADGKFTNNFELSNGINETQHGKIKVIDKENDVTAQKISGTVDYIAPNGEHVHYKYKADETGYHVEGSHIPVAPALPPLIARSLEYQRAHATEAPIDA